MKRPYEDQACRAKWRDSFNRKAWAVTNFGILHSTHRTRRDAIAEARRQRSDSFTWRQIYEIRRVTITEGWAS